MDTEYARDEFGEISIVLNKYVRGAFGEICIQLGDFYTREFTGERWEREVKTSKNIIDLIEVNDIIGTKLPAFKEIYYEHIWSDEYLKYIKDYLNEKKLILIQILTHEQYEQNCYRLEEK